MTTDLKSLGEFLDDMGATLYIPRGNERLLRYGTQ